MKSKWFTLKGKVFESKRKAKNSKEAWEKTLEKWQLIMDGYEIIFLNGAGTCGLCNIYDCKNCVVFKATDTDLCLYFIEQPDLEYLFLLFVKEATQNE